MRSLALAVLLAGCASFPERLAHATIPSPAMGGAHMEYAVYAPRDLAPGERLPLVVFLHGGGDGPDAFDRHGVSARLDEEIAAGRVPRVVIALPEGDLGFWANWEDGTRRYEDWVIGEVIPTVAARFHTQPCPEGCHVMGVSMGGIGALRFALHRPGLFASVGSISGPVPNAAQMVSFARDPWLSLLIPMQRIFGPIEPVSRHDREDLFQRWTTPESTRIGRIFVAWGTRDREPIRNGSHALDAHLTEHGIEHRALEFDGDHAWRSWIDVIFEALRYAIEGT